MALLEYKLCSAMRLFFIFILFCTTGFSQTPLSRLLANSTPSGGGGGCVDPTGPNVGTATGVATYECIGLYWTSSGGGSSTTCNVQYRVSGGCEWSDGLALVWDSRGF